MTNTDIGKIADEFSDKLCVIVDMLPLLGSDIRSCVISMKTLAVGSKVIILSDQGVDAKYSDTVDLMKLIFGCSSMAREIALQNRTISDYEHSGILKIVAGMNSGLDLTSGMTDIPGPSEKLVMGTLENFRLRKLRVSDDFAGTSYKLLTCGHSDRYASMLYGEAFVIAGSYDLSHKHEKGCLDIGGTGICWDCRLQPGTWSSDGNGFVTIRLAIFRV